jgi:very-short-patch-repair endonuclease
MPGVKRLRDVETKCVECATPFTAPAFHKSQVRKHCSTECRKKAWARGMKRVSVLYADKIAERMRTNNPMADLKLRERVRQKITGCAPAVRGGNGNGLTKHELAIAQALNWLPVTVSTHGYRNETNRLPKNYKIDVGNTGMKIAVEIDGRSHNALARKAQDAKKTAFLESIGWTVLRFTNKEVDQNLTACVQAVLSTISRLTRTTTSS